MDGWEVEVVACPIRAAELMERAAGDLLRPNRGRGPDTGVSHMAAEHAPAGGVGCMWYAGGQGSGVEAPGPDVLEAWHAWAGAAVAAGARAGSTQRAGSERFAAAQAEVSSGG
ncbi:hypothetical protein ACCO45_011464 [Purpureocillium lilacinum]|uniref:Uncharacterized protein n=1 Tax=Purpureocillium lilacinum TaxID=33203 RepID=A0ACC4DBU1_PURLI